MKAPDRKQARQYLRSIQPLQKYFKPDQQFGQIFEQLLARQHGVSTASCGLPAKFQVRWAQSWVGKLKQIAPAHFKAMKYKQLQSLLAELELRATPRRFSSLVNIRFTNQVVGAVSLVVENRLKFNPQTVAFWLEVVENQLISPHLIKLEAGQKIIIDLSQYQGELQVVTARGRLIARTQSLAQSIEPVVEAPPMEVVESTEPTPVEISAPEVEPSVGEVSEPSQPIPLDVLPLEIVPPTFAVTATHDRVYVYFRFELMSGQMHAPINFQITPTAWKAARGAEFFIQGQLSRLDEVGKYLIRAIPIPAACWIQVWVGDQPMKMFHNIARHRRAVPSTTKRPELPEIWAVQPSSESLKVSRPGIREEHLRRAPAPIQPSEEYHNYDWGWAEHFPVDLPA